MYNLTSLQILQAHLKLLESSALMLVYTNKKPRSGQDKDDDVEMSIKNKGIWYWLQSNTTPQQFAELRIKACLDNELFIFDVDIPLDVLKADSGSSWRSTYLHAGNIVYSQEV